MENSINVEDPSATIVVVDEKPEVKRKQQPRYNVILVDDNDHTYEYVIDMLGRVFGFNKTRSFKMACEVDSAGRVIVLTTSLEHAELKQQQIHGFGPDPQIPTCKGSMTAELEAVPE